MRDVVWAVKYRLAEFCLRIGTNVPEVCRLMITGCFCTRLVVELAEVFTDFFWTDFRADGGKDVYFLGVLGALFVRLRSYLSFACSRAISFSAF